MNLIKGLKIAALIPLGLAAAILLVFAAGEASAGDWSGFGHLIPVALIGLLTWLGWKRPLWGGLILLTGSLLAALIFSPTLRRPDTWEAPYLLFVAPLFFSGCILLVAAWLGRKQP